MVINAYFFSLCIAKTTTKKPNLTVIYVYVSKNLCKFYGCYLQITTVDVGNSITGFYNDAGIDGKKVPKSDRRPGRII